MAEPAFKSQESLSPGATIYYAGFWYRFCAFFIDQVILGILGSFVCLLFIFILNIVFPNLPVQLLAISQSGGKELKLLAFAVYGFLFTVGLVLNWVYFVYFETSEPQATPGKLLLGLYVTDLKGEPIKFWQSTRRTFSKILSLLPIGLGFVIAGFTRKKQALHDILSKSLVLKRD